MPNREVLPPLARRGAWGKPWGEFWEQCKKSSCKVHGFGRSSTWKRLVPVQELRPQLSRWCCWCNVTTAYVLASSTRLLLEEIESLPAMLHSRLHSYFGQRWARCSVESLFSCAWMVVSRFETIVQSISDSPWPAYTRFESWGSIWFALLESTSGISDAGSWCGSRLYIRVPGRTCCSLYPRCGCRSERESTYDKYCTSISAPCRVRAYVRGKSACESNSPPVLLLNPIQEPHPITTFQLVPPRRAIPREYECSSPIIKSC